MPACAQCEKPTERLKCSKCRRVVYCSADCQKADWEEHKISCKPSLIYVTEQVMALHNTQQWRKLLFKWNSYLNPLLEVMDDDGQHHMLTIYKQANQRGSNATSDPVYASNCVPILQKLIDIDGKHKRYEAQGKQLCELGQSFSWLDNEIEQMACYLKACEIGDKHNIGSVKCVGNLGLGRIFTNNKRLFEAKSLLRLALDAAQSGDTYWMKQHAVMCSDELCDVLFKTNSVDEAGPLVKRFPKLLEKSLGPSSPRLQHYHMRGFVMSARFFEAKNRPEEAASEIYKMLSLIEDNKADIHDWRPLFLHLLDHAIEHLRILDDTDIGNFELAKKVYRLRDEQRQKTW